MNVFKQKSLYIQLTFRQNQFYKISSFKINLSHCIAIPNNIGYHFFSTFITQNTVLKGIPQQPITETKF